jgi:transposase InsO family protein
MDRVLAGLPMVFVYLDDIIVASISMEQHQLHVEEVFRRLRSAGLVINKEKCEFAVPEVQFLGHHVTAGGILPLPEKVVAIQEHPKPGTVKQLQAFLGVVNFYRRFVPAAAKLLRPLTDSLKGSPKPTAAVEWTAELEKAFASAKSALCQAALLAHPRQGWELALMVDASADHVGAALQQRETASSPWQPLAFFSKKLEPAQVRYSAFDRELFACCAGIRHFRYMLEGRLFTIYTDHKPLTFALSKVADAWTAMQCRQLSYVAEFTTDIRHVPGADNVVADTLSRPPSSASSGPDSSSPTTSAGPDSSLPRASAGPDSSASPVSAVAASSELLDYAAIARHQLLCPTVQKAQSSSSLRLVHVHVQGQQLLCDVSNGGRRPLIPEVDRKAVFAAFHGLAHPGIRATRRLMSARVIWRGMSSDIAAWCRDCQQCARGKASPQPAAPVQPIPVPERRFTHVHVDLVGPLPTSAEGFTYLFTMVDRSTRWLEAVPIKSMSAQVCVDTFIATWVARYGVPATITSDQGRQFTSALWTGLHKLLGVQLITTTAYHPQSNGMVERCHGQLKAALRARLAGTQWPEHLPWVLLGLRTAPKEDSAISSAELMFGTALSLPAEFLSSAEPPAEEFLEKLREADMPATRPPTYAEMAARPPQALFEASHVYVRRGGTIPPLSPLYVGPYKVLARQAKHFRLELGGRQETVSVDRLKPHLGLTPVQPAAPPSRGRPSTRVPVSDTS